MDTGNLHSGLHACTAGILLTETSPSPFYYYHYYYQCVCVYRHASVVRVPYSPGWPQTPRVAEDNLKLLILLLYLLSAGIRSVNHDAWFLRHWGWNPVPSACQVSHPSPAASVLITAVSHLNLGSYWQASEVVMVGSTEPARPSFLASMASNGSLAS